MNPTVARGGRSFKGAFLYYMHDKEANTRERVAWAHAVNMLTTDPDKAWKVMAYTAKHQERLKEASGQKMTGRKAQKPVLAYSLSWHPDQDPSPEHMRETAIASLKILGLEGHEALIVAHSDTPHRHVHIIANRVHPITGKIASDSYTYRKLSDFALAYGQEHGLTYSPQRAENKRKREEGQMTRYQDSKIAEAWAASDDGKTLVAALAERGFILAQGNKRLVVVDIYGKIHNPTRHIEGVDAKGFKERLKGVDLKVLPDAEIVAQERAAQHEHGKPARKKQREAAPEPVAVKEPQEPAPATADAKEPASPPGPECEAKEPEPEAVDHAALRLNSIQDRHIEERAALHERFYTRLQREKEELSAYYRLPEKVAAIDALRQKCESPAFWRRILGLARRDRRTLAGMELTYENARWRYDERIQSMESQHARNVDMLNVAQKREWETALRLYAQKTPSARQAVAERTAVIHCDKYEPGFDYRR